MSLDDNYSDVFSYLNLLIDSWTLRDSDIVTSPNLWIGISCVRVCTCVWKRERAHTFVRFLLN